jgi:hypothetical protein
MIGYGNITRRFVRLDGSFAWLDLAGSIVVINNHSFISGVYMQSCACAVCSSSFFFQSQLAPLQPGVNWECNQRCLCLLAVVNSRKGIISVCDIQRRYVTQLIDIHVTYVTHLCDNSHSILCDYRMWHPSSVVVMAIYFRRMKLVCTGLERVTGRDRFRYERDCVHCDHGMGWNGMADNIL